MEKITKSYPYVNQYFVCNRCGWDWISKFAICPYCGGRDVEIESFKEVSDLFKFIEEEIENREPYNNILL